MKSRLLLLFVPSLALLSCEKQANQAGRKIGEMSDGLARGIVEKPMERLEKNRVEAQQRLQWERDRLENEKALRDSLPNGPRTR